MSARKIGAVIFGLGALIVIGFTIYKISAGKDVGFNEIITIACLVMIFLTSITWGSKEEKDGILPGEELGQRITEKSSKVGYFLLTFFYLGRRMCRSAHSWNNQHFFYCYYWDWR
ncbi:hypothetical protein [Paenibacillus sp. DMB20]|uniref:hypothetical protein n=1 Tax=Paenibacillus sp. DMB20 TaxID=1642570 RepID=UPI000AA67AFE|nr:hypothetical protein [Paenibacillus sp. DMB20]